MESRQDLVLVTGVTGKQGGAIARELVAKGVRVRGMTRHPESDSSVASAHRQTGIPHFENKWRIEQTVRDLGFPTHVVLRPVFFMENLTSPSFLPAIQQGQLAVGMEPTTVLQMIAVQDIGKYGAWAFDKHRELNGRGLDIAGDQLTMQDAATLISAAAQHPIAFFRVPIEQVRAFGADLAMMLEWFDRTGYDADIAALSRESGISPTRFEEWAHAAWKAPVAAS